MASELHVAIDGPDDGDGSVKMPFRRIQQAADRAKPGDTVTVHAGEYREWVKPRRGGLSDSRRITYRAADGEHVTIKGSERITGWENDGGTVWKVTVANALFGDFNPYEQELGGDWIVYPPGAPKKHLGDVYSDGLSFYEVTSRDEVTAAPRREQSTDDWTGVTEPVRNPAQTQLVWYAEAGADTTTIWANFQGADPNTTKTEINVRRSVFYPVEHHLDYLTVRGFELAHAACPWTPPTADQPGLIGPNWAKGWIIEDNDIHDAKCSAVSLGKEASTGHNYASLRGDKPGYQYQLESVFAARQIGWDKEHIGSHVVRRNTIHDCGQNGVVGHLGCVFSTIEDNHIYNIATKREYYGYEIGGIKLHAAIDVTIRRNNIHDCTLGTWLDWQTQGTRITRNVYHHNNRDLFIEVSHGPYIVDHNILASAAAVELFSQGGAFVGNLITGTVRLEAVPDRATPYHRPHSTQVAGYAVIWGGDDRWIGNVFLDAAREDAYGRAAEGHGLAHSGLFAYDGFPASFEEYLARIEARPPGDHQRFLNLEQAVHARGNVFANGAGVFGGEPDPLILDGVTAAVVTDGDGVHLEIDLPAGFDRARPGMIGAADLPRARFADAEFEEPDGSPARFDTDLTGSPRTDSSAAGPLAGLKPGKSRVRVW